jgi:hypothetical protein
MGSGLKIAVKAGRGHWFPPCGKGFREKDIQVTVIDDLSTEAFKLSLTINNLTIYTS